MRTLLVAVMLVAVGYGLAPASPPLARMVLQTSHHGGITAVSHSPDGRWLASASMDGTIKLWDVVGGGLVDTLIAAQGKLTCVAFSRRGRLLASGGEDGSVRLWEPLRGTLLRSVPGTEPVTSLAFSTRGALAVGSCQENLRRIRVFDPYTGTLLRAIEESGEALCGLAFSPNGTELAAAIHASALDRNVVVEIFDPSSGALLRTLKSRHDTAEAVAYSPDGKLLAAASQDREVDVWEADTTVWLGAFPTDTAARSVSFSNDGSLLAAACGQPETTGEVVVWPLSDLSEQALPWKRFTCGSDVANACAFSPRGGLLAGGNADRTLALWNLNSGQTMTLSSASASQWSASPWFGADGSLRIAGYPDQPTAAAAYLWNAADGRVSLLQGSTEFSARCLAVSPDGKRAACGDGLGSILLWDIQSGGCGRLPGHRGPVNALAFSPNGSLLASGGDDNALGLWDTAGGLVRMLDAHTAYLTDVEFSPDASMLASGSFDRRLRIWDSSGALLLSLNAPVTINSVAVNASSRKATCGLGDPSQDGQVLLWDLNAPQHPQVLQPNSGGPVTAVALSADGGLLAAGGTNGSITLWANGSSPRLLNGHNGSVTRLAFCPRGHLLASGSQDRTVKLWSTESGRLLFTWMLRADGNSLEWLAFSPQGNYCGSSGCERLFHWRVGDALLPASAYHAALFKPDLTRDY